MRHLLGKSPGPERTERLDKPDLEEPVVALDYVTDR